MAIRIVVPGEPRGKGRGKIVTIRKRGGGSFSTLASDKPTVIYENLIKGEAARVMRGRPPTSEPVVVTIVTRRTAPKRTKAFAAAVEAGQVRPTSKPDWDNYIKCLDALNGVVWVDDAQVVEGHMAKLYATSKHPPGMTIIIEPWSAPE